MRYKIEVHSQGYDDTFMIVDAPSLAEAKFNLEPAIMEWCERNDVDLWTGNELAFTRITKVNQ